MHKGYLCNLTPSHFPSLTKFLFGISIAVRLLATTLRQCMKCMRFLPTGNINLMQAEVSGHGRSCQSRACSIDFLFPTESSDVFPKPMVKDESPFLIGASKYGTNKTDFGGWKVGISANKTIIAKCLSMPPWVRFCAAPSLNSSLF